MFDSHVDKYYATLASAEGIADYIRECRMEKKPGIVILPDGHSLHISVDGSFFMEPPEGTGDYDT
jgi:hypothetical protein